MNQIILKGQLKNIDYSHTINDVEYDKADLVTTVRGDDYIIPLRFKKYSNRYEEGQTIELAGNVRSYSQKLENGKNKVNIYVFTYFDIPEQESDTEVINHFEIDGRICKMQQLNVNNNGKHNIHFILANNIISQNKNQKLNNYLPCVAFGQTAIELSKLSVSQKILIKGELHSRLYKKEYDNGEIEFKTAHELAISDFEVLE